MSAKYLFKYSLATLCCLLCFVLSLQTLTQAGGWQPVSWHVCIALHAVIAILFVFTALQRFRVNSTMEWARVLCVAALFFGTFGVVNILLLNFEAGKGLFLPWLLGLFVLFHYRRLFFPFHLEGTAFVNNLVFAAAIMLAIKIVVLTGGLSPLPLIGPALGIDEAYREFYDLPRMSASWSLGLALYLFAMFMIRDTARQENEEELLRIRSELNLSGADMCLLGLSNDSLLGKSRMEVEDIILASVSGLVESSSRYSQVKRIMSSTEGTGWMGQVSGLIEHKE
jgi:hypothetical protein